MNPNAAHKNTTICQRMLSNQYMTQLRDLKKSCSGTTERLEEVSRDPKNQSINDLAKAGFLEWVRSLQCVTSASAGGLFGSAIAAVHSRQESYHLFP